MDGVPPRWTRRRSAGLFTAGLVVASAIAAFFGWTAWRNARRDELYANEHNADASLRVLSALQRDFWTQDLDRDGAGNFWAGDVAGLVALRHALGPGKFPGTEGWGQFDAWMARHLQALSSADPSKPGARPYRGYWFVAVKRDGRHQFGFCAYPAEYGWSGRRTYIISDERSPTARDMDGAPVLQWPAEIELRNLWPACISG